MNPYKLQIFAQLLGELFLFGDPVGQYLEINPETGITLNDGVTSVTMAKDGNIAITTTTGALILPNMTTTERDAITPATGMIIYNSTTTTVQAYLGAIKGWTSL